MQEHAALTSQSRHMLDGAVRTKALSPSKLSIALECPLRYLLETENRAAQALPDSIPICLGRAVHTTIDALARGVLERDTTAVQRAVTQEFIRLAVGLKMTRYVLQALNMPPGPATMLPVSDYIERMRVAIRAVADLDGPAETTSPSPSHSKAERQYVGKPSNHFGAEVVRSSTSLDLSGRADRIERQPDGSIRVTEYKTGLALVHGDVPTDAVLIQVCAYALVQSQLTPATRILVRVIAPNGEWEQPFTPELAATILKTIKLIRERMPRGIRLRASDIASPSRRCLFCRFRPICLQYRHAAESQWRSESQPFAFDTWGEVERIERTSPQLANVRLRDQAGRGVRIANVPSEALVEAGVGDSLEVFELVSSEVGRGNASPHNFQIVDVRQPYRSAFSAVMNLCGGQRCSA
jgi:hypothetical protein